MVAFNFHARFVKGVESGDKPWSIRSKQKCDVGDAVQHYTNMRQKNCRKLADGICTGVYAVTISENDLKITPVGNHDNLSVDDLRILAKAHKEDFAKKLGFGSWGSCTKWYEDLYGLPFSGFLHIWKMTMRPMKSAPRDGTDIFGIYGGERHKIYWCAHGYGASWMKDLDTIVGEPDGWLPLNFVSDVALFE